MEIISCGFIIGEVDNETIKDKNQRLKHLADFFPFVHHARKFEMTKVIGIRLKLISVSNQQRNSAMVFVRGVYKNFTPTFTMRNRYGYRPNLFFLHPGKGARRISIMKIVNQEGEVADTVLIDKLNSSVHFQKAKFK